MAGVTPATALIWLKIASAFTIVFGLVIAAASTAAGDGIWLWLYDLVKWPLDGNPSGFSDDAFAINGLLGGVMVGWATLMFLVVSRRLAHGDIDLVDPLLISIVAWFVVDSTASVLAELAGNVVLNTLFLVLFVVPLLALRRSGTTT